MSARTSAAVEVALPAGPTKKRRVLEALRELLLLGAVYAVYKAGRTLANGHEASAYDHAHTVRAIEAALRFPSEATIQAAVGFRALFEVANVYYVSVHFPLTIAFLVWGFVARPASEYRWARNLLVVQTGLALVIHIAYPLAPPRMFPQWRFVDTMTTYGPSAYNDTTDAFVNQFAAMPSLHIGWAALIAVVVRRTGPTWMSRLASGHALLTVCVVIVTANHWWLDGLVAVGLLGIALRVVPGPASEARHRPRCEGAGAPRES